MKNKKPTLTFSSLLFTFPVFVALFCAILCIVNGYIGYRTFKSLFEEQYKSITEQFAYTALSYIDGDKITDYAKTLETDEEWEESNRKLNVLTNTAALAYIYVTVIDDNFESRTYIFDTVHPEVEGGKIIPFGTVGSLKNRDEDYINNLKKVLVEGESEIRFVYNDTGGHVTTSVPVKNSAGKNVAILGLVKPMSEVKTFKQQYLKSTFISSAAFTIAFIVIFILIMLFKVLRPLKLITNETSQFTKHRGTLSGKLKSIRGKSELSSLARSVEKMSVDMQKYIDDLTHATAEKERLGAELNVATQIQANMLPRIFPPYADHPEIELFASMEPAKEVGGDFYDFFMVDDDHFAVLVGDVSGKGVPAALFMVIAKTLLKNMGMHSTGPAQTFDMVNDQLCEGNDAGLFVTCWMGILTLSTGELKFANAGHTPPLIYKNKSVEYLNVKPNLMLAGLPGTKYTEHSINLNRGDRLFLYTDGITEATNANNELYGEDRLLNVIKNANAANPKELLAKIRADIDEFVKDAPQFDDITMLELSLKG